VFQISNTPSSSLIHHFSSRKPNCSGYPGGKTAKKLCSEKLHVGPLDPEKQVTVHSSSVCYHLIMRLHHRRRFIPTATTPASQTGHQPIPFPPTHHFSPQNSCGPLFPVASADHRVSDSLCSPFVNALNQYSLLIPHAFHVYSSAVLYDTPSWWHHVFCFRSISCLRMRA
jgi:hypothetical protein